MDLLQTNYMSLGVKGPLRIDLPSGVHSCSVLQHFYEFNTKTTVIAYNLLWSRFIGNCRLSRAETSVINYCK